MDNAQIRRMNVNLLIEEVGSVQEFARRIDRDPGQVSQWRNVKDIGSRLARHIEECFNKPTGWLDLPQWKETDPSTALGRLAEAQSPYLGLASQPPRFDPEILRSAHRLLREIYAEDEEGFKVYSIEDDPELFITAYQTLARLGDSAQPADFVALTRILDKQKAGQGREQTGQLEGTSRPHQETGKKRAAG